MKATLELSDKELRDLIYKKIRNTIKDVVSINEIKFTRDPGGAMSASISVEMSTSDSSGEILT